MFYRATAFFLFFSFTVFLNFETHAQSTASLKVSGDTTAKNGFLSKGKAADAGSVAPTDNKTTPAERKMLAVSLNNQATALAAVGQNAEAAAILQRAIDADGTLASAYYNLSVVYDRLERYEDALMAAYSALTIDPDFRSARIEVCQLMVSLDRDTNAVKCYEALRPLSPLDPIIKRNYAAMLLRTEQWSKAKDIVVQLLLDNPNDAAVHMALGYIQYRRGKFDDAIASFRRALEIDPSLDKAHFNLAVALLAKKRRDESLDQYRLLRSSNPELADELYKMIFSDKVLTVNNK